MNDTYEYDLTSYQINGELCSHSPATGTIPQSPSTSTAQPTTSKSTGPPVTQPPSSREDFEYISLGYVKSILSSDATAMPRLCTKS